MYNRCFLFWFSLQIYSPNTPGLRNLQHHEELERLIEAVVNARDSVAGKHKPPILLKIAPDLSQEDKQDIAYVILRKGVCIMFFQINYYSVFITTNVVEFIKMPN